MYILLKSIHIKYFSKKFGGTAVPHATTLEPPLPGSGIVGCIVVILVLHGMIEKKNPSSLTVQGFFW